MYKGQCVGGPYAGKWLAHYSTTYKLLKPVMEFSLAKDPANLAVEAAPVCEYEFLDNQWVWKPA